jgi:septation ring formation regulator EzrA
MKKISLWLLMLVFAVSLARAQNTATQQQLDELRGHYQDAQESLRSQEQRIATLEKEIAELREKANTPVVNDSASRGDLKKLAEQVQEIDRKRQDDRDLILKEIEKLGKAAAIPPTPTMHRTLSTAKTSKAPEDTGTAAVPSKGYEYLIKQGDTLGQIIKAYRDQGVKVTKSQIVAANPKLNPEVLIPGKKIFIPDPTAK